VNERLRQIPNSLGNVPSLSLQVRGPQVYLSPDGMVPAAEPPPAAPEPAPAAPEPNPDAADNAFGSKALGDIFDFDPFADTSAEPPPATPEPAPTPTPPTGEETQPAPSQPETPPAASGNDELLAGLKAIIEKAAAPAEPSAPAGGSSESASAEPENYFADVVVPDTLVNALASEDQAERRVAVNLLVQGTMNQVYKRVRAEMAEFVEQGLPQYFQAYTQAQRETVDMHEDFYVRQFPELNVPEIKPWIGQLALRLAQEEKVQRYTPEFGKKLGEKVAETLAKLGVQLKPPPNPTPPPPTPQPFSPGSSVRVSQTPDISDEIREVLGF